MSWSASGRGTKEDVAVKVYGDFYRIDYLSGDEEKLKDLARQLVHEGLNAQPAGTQVKVECVGRASSNGAIVTQYVSVLIEPLNV